MALVIKDRVKETTITTGTGTITLAGAVSGFQGFTAIGNGNSTYYVITDTVTGDWEVGIGTYTASGTTLSRTTVLSSSNAGALVPFAAGIKDVFVSYPSSRAVYQNEAGSSTVQGDFVTINATTANLTAAALTTGTVSAAPVNNTDIVNKQYADAIASGIHFHEAVELATTAALPANTYNNGTGGVGATLTANANGALSVDSTLTVVGNRILIKNEAAGANNGVYVVTQVGSAGAPYILTRSTDFDSVGGGVDQIDEGDFFLVTSGVANVNTAWVQQTPPPITLGTTAIVFQQFSAPITYTAGTGLNESPTYTFNIANTGVTASTYGSASAVPVFAVNAQGQITSVTNTPIAINGSAVTGNIAGSAGSVANALTLGAYLTGTSYNGSSAVTATVDATSANTANKVVARDGSGNFSAGTITAALSGNATTATTATNLAGGAANQLAYQTATNTTGFTAAPTASGELLSWNGSSYTWTLTPTVTSITLSGGTANGVAYLNGSKQLTTGSALNYASGTGVGNLLEVTGGSNNINGQLNIQGTDGTNTSFVSLLSGLEPTNLPSLFFSNGLRFATATNKTASGYSEQMRLSSSLLSVVPGATIQGLTVGRGAGAVSSNTAVGASALAANTTGSQGTATGDSALIANTTGIRNSAFGFNALLNVTTGNRNTAIGRGTLLSITSDSDNTAVGANALFSFTSGSFNTAVGSGSLTGSGSTGSNNTAVGYQSLTSNTTASYNTAVGYQALTSTTTGSYNTAVGLGSQGLNTTGTENQSFGHSSLGANTTGSYNVALGASALRLNTTASNNTAVGYQSLYSNTASDNTAVGYQALYANTTGIRSTAVGFSALGANTTGVNTAVGYGAAGTTTTGSNNVAFGYYALVLNSTGSNNTALGQDSLFNNTTASNNTAVGYQAGYSNTTGTLNVFLGERAGYSNTTASSSTAVGSAALRANTTGVSNSMFGRAVGFSNTTGSRNSAFGGVADTNVSTFEVNTTGSYNTAMGNGALALNTTASNNTAVGYQAGYSNTTGPNNTFVGTVAGYSNTTGGYSLAIGGVSGTGLQTYYANTTGGANLAVGHGALAANTTATFNTALGYEAVAANTTGQYNVGVGPQALRFNTTASNNTAVGFQAGYSNSTGTSSAFFGYQAGYSSGGSNNTALGTSAMLFTSSGGQNTAVGAAALLGNTTASYNTAVGFQAGYTGTGANFQYNTFVGYRAGYSANPSVLSYGNVCIGSGTGQNITTGYSNTIVGAIGEGGGDPAGSNLTTGLGNTFIGTMAGNSMTTGSQNTILGSFTGNQGGLDIRTANNYIVLSDGDGTPRIYTNNHGAFSVGFNSSASSGLNQATGAMLMVSDYNNGGFGCLSLGAPSGNYGSVGYGFAPTNTGFVYTNNDVSTRINFGTTLATFTASSGTAGNAITYTAGPYVSIGGTSWTSSSDARLKNVTGGITGALAKVQAMNPVWFSWKRDAANAQNLGFIAQELQQVLPEVVDVPTHEIDPRSGEQNYWGVNYTEIVPLLTAAIQELKAEFDAYKATHP